MGFKVNFRGEGNSKSPLAEGTWEVSFKKFDTWVSQNNNQVFKAVFVVTDPDAVDTEGNSYTKRWVSSDLFNDQAMWKFKRFASEAGIELPDDEVEYDDAAEFIESLNDLFEGYYMAQTEITQSQDGTREFGVVNSLK